MWVRTQDRETLLEIKNIQYMEKQSYTDNYFQLEKDVKKNYNKYINPKTYRRLEYYEINDYLADRAEYITKFCIYHYNGDDFNLLGRYSTKERCLEVLDEIQECIDLGYVPIRRENMKTQERQVFQMPKD